MQLIPYIYCFLNGFVNRLLEGIILLDNKSETEYNEATQKAYSEDEEKLSEAKDDAASTGSVSIVVA